MEEEIRQLKAKLAEIDAAVHEHTARFDALRASGSAINIAGSGGSIHDVTISRARIGMNVVPDTAISKSKIDRTDIAINHITGDSRPDLELLFDSASHKMRIVIEHLAKMPRKDAKTLADRIGLGEHVGELQDLIIGNPKNEKESDSGYLRRIENSSPYRWGQLLALVDSLKGMFGL